MSRRFPRYLGRAGIAPHASRASASRR